MQENDVERHYGRAGLIERLSQALRQAGKDLERLTVADLAPVDEFHVRGRPATEELAAKLQPRPDWHVLDLGCGIGGPSRYLASTFGCRVTGVDLTQAYCEAATWLADRVGLGQRLGYRRADALHLPFADGSFDAAWTQHVAMNIADKPGLYREARRVLAAGGWLAIYDIVQGPGGPVIFPVPWASGPELSHLVTAEELQRLVADAGFKVTSFADRTEAGREWFAGIAERLAQPSPPPMALSLLLGPEFRAIAGNLGRNLDEQRIEVVELIGRAP